MRLPGTRLLEHYIGVSHDSGDEWMRMPWTYLACEVAKRPQFAVWPSPRISTTSPSFGFLIITYIKGASCS